MTADGSGGVVAHGYLLSGVEYTTIDLPGVQVNRGVSRIAQQVGNEATRQNPWRGF